MARELTRRRTQRDTSYAKPAEEETRPRRGRRAAAEPEDKPTRGRRAPREEDKPSRRGTGKVTKGWGSYKKTAEATKGGNFAAEFKPDDKETELIKILDEGPFAVFKQHWIERGPNKKKSFNCLKDDDDQGDCPLCDDLGDRPKPQAWVNVVNVLEEPDKREVLIWKVGSLVGDILENAANEKRTSPINKPGLYWSVEKKVKSKRVEYHIQAVKEDEDFATDWDTTPLTEEEIEAFTEEAYDDDEVYFNTIEELEEIVDEISN